MFDVTFELDKLKSDGIYVSMPELVRFKSLANLISLRPSARAASQLAGSERSLFKGRGMEFDEARHYQPGDDIRSIDWRVTARTGRTHTKIFREERERPVFLFVDLRQSMHFGTQLLFKSVQAAHVAALIAWAAVARGDKLGGIVFNEHQDLELKPRAQTKSALHFLHAVSQLQNSAVERSFEQTGTVSLVSAQTSKSHSQEALLRAFKRMHYLAKPGSLIHVISDGSDLAQAHLALIGDLSRHCEIKVSLVQDPFERELPHSNEEQMLKVSDGVNKGAVLLGDSAYAQDYRQKQLSRIEYITNELAKVRVSASLISAGRALDSQLQAHPSGFVMGQNL